MVDAVVSYAVKRLSDALIGETHFLLCVHSQIRELRDELRRMMCFLKDADAKQQGDEGVRNWVADIRNVAYDAEDVVDTFILRIDAGAKSGGVINFITRKALMVKNLKHLYRVGKEMQTIRSRLKFISDSRVTYGINDLSGSEASSSKANRMTQQQLRNHYPHIEDDDVIGLEEHTKTLLTELVKDDERRCVVSIVGVGGLGKTTLAKKIYKHDTVMSRFDCRAWTSISQQLNTRDALLEIIKKSMNPSDDELSKIKELIEGDLVEKLYHYLQDKRYLIVVDDLWSFEAWNTLSPAFPNGKKGSKVLLTTRNKEVASQIDPWSLQLEPGFLNDEDAWELLCKKAFPKSMRDDDCYPTGLKKLGTDMVCKCGGLPLAICVLGGILATKRAEIKEWEYVNRDITWHLNKCKNGGVMGVLALSYNDLPVHLKPCFLYLGLFPEDYAIPRKKLIQLWIAEGFIPHTKETALVTLEDVGKHQYYAELIQRCMIQADKDTTPWLGKTCRMHDLMRDMCLSKAKDMNFLGYNRNTDDDTCRRLRRYAIHLNDESRRYDDFYFNNSACALRTLFIQIPLGNPLAALKYNHIKLLRVLDLENVAKFTTDITKDVSKLIHLRYLALGRIQFDIPISSSIGDLRNLQTLKFVYFRGLRLPETIKNLVQLRHLEIRLRHVEKESGKVAEKFEIESLINLQTLNYIQAGEWIRKGCLRKLSKLRKLSVLKATRIETDLLIHEIINSDDRYQNPIRVLCIQSISTFDSKIFKALSCCHYLYHIQFSGRLDVLNLQRCPPNLTKLKLYGSMLKEDPMESLQHLPNLKSLVMNKTYIGGKMVCSATGFPQLQYLRIFGFDRLKGVDI